jgi:DNA-3-methyladenine glycosylase I
MKRCGWARNKLIIAYHDKEWGVPVHDDRMLLEFLILEGAQAGLSWETILKKREHYRRAFDNFDAAKIALYDKHKFASLMNDAGIIRNHLKIDAAIRNAMGFLKIKEEFGTFDSYIWQFVEGQTIKNKWRELKEIPARSKESDDMSRELKRRGFKFVGTTICYAFMQATGMVNDHLVSCFRYKEI